MKISYTDGLSSSFAGQIGSGKAQVFGKPNDPIEYLQRVQVAADDYAKKKRLQDNLLKAQRQTEGMKEAAKFVEITVDPWERDVEQIGTLTQKFRELAADAFATYGGVPPVNSEAYRALEKAKMKIGALADTSKRHKDAYAVAVSKIGDPNVDQKVLAQNLKAFSEAESIEGRDPLSRNFTVPLFDPYEGLDTIPVSSITTDVEKGDVTTKTVRVDAAKLGKTVDDYMLTPQGVQDYVRGKEDGVWSTPEEYRKFALDYLTPKMNTSLEVSQDEKTGDANFQFGSGGGFYSNNNFTIGFGSDVNHKFRNDGTPDINYSPINYNGGVPRAIYFKDDSGKRVPLIMDYIATEDASSKKGSETLRLFGKKAKVVGASEFVRSSAGAQIPVTAASDEDLAVNGMQRLEDGMVVNLKETESVSVPFDSMPGKQGASNFTRFNALIGDNYYDLLYEANQANGTPIKGKSSASQKTGNLTQAAFDGLLESEKFFYEKQSDGTYVKK
jgi:hypothetical protein